MTHVFLLSHNNAREGAPRLCSKLAVGLHRSGWFDKVFLCALHPGAAPEPDIPVVKIDQLVRQVRALLQQGHRVRLILSTVICTRLARALRTAVGVDASGDNFRVIGLIHEVRNETFAWVTPADMSSLDRVAFVARYTAGTYGPEFAPGLERAVIHNWLAAAERETIDGIPGTARRRLVLQVAVVAKHKGQLHVARAFAKLRETFPEYRLAFVGHVYDSAYAEQIRAIDPAIEITGAVGHGEVMEMMRSCDIYVHGSPMESCCLSIMEAMYCGCPVVAARVGGVPEEISDGVDGLLYEYGDHEACGDLLLRLASDVPLRESLGEAARGSVSERFAEGDKLAAYRELLG